MGGMSRPKDLVRIAAVADIHCGRIAEAVLQSLLTHASQDADVLLLCGDLVDHGLPDEARVLAKLIAATIRIPMLAVLGNHDFEADKQAEIEHILADVGVDILDGEAREVHGIGFAGVKGFAGGFGKHVLQPWGEAAIKSFVHEAVEESLKLESALSRLQMTHRIALLHYAPIQQTVEGEACEVFPFLGSSRLEEPLNRYPVTAVFHGHAHCGSPQGQTAATIPVYNVSVPVLQRAYPEQPPFRILELPAGAAAAPAAAAAR